MLSEMKLWTLATEFLRLIPKPDSFYLSTQMMIMFFWKNILAKKSEFYDISKKDKVMDQVVHVSIFNLPLTSY